MSTQRLGRQATRAPHVSGVSRGDTSNTLQAFIYRQRHTVRSTLARVILASLCVLTLTAWTLKWAETEESISGFGALKLATPFSADEPLPRQSTTPKQDSQQNYSSSHIHAPEGKVRRF